MLQDQQVEQSKVLSLNTSLQDPSGKPKSLREEIQQIIRDAAKEGRLDDPDIKELCHFFEEMSLRGSIMERIPDSLTFDPDIHTREFNKMARTYLEERICCACQRAQLRQFGSADWQKDYWRVAIAYPEHYDELIRGEEGDVLHASRLRGQLMKSLMESRSPQMKTIQSLFSDNREVVYKVTDEHSPERDIQASLISPRCIPDKLLEDLHLADFSDCKGNPLARLERKADLVTINALKAIFANMRSLRGGRDFILKEVHPKANDFGVPREELEERLAEYNRYCPGAILDVSEDKIEKVLEECDGGFEFRRCKVSYFSDANSRIRAGYYTQDSYAVERDQLAEHIQDIIAVGELLQGWKKDTLPELKKKFGEDLLAFVSELEECLELARNSYKIDVAQICKMIKERPDMQKNPSACLMTLSKAVREFEKRLKESNYKDGAKLRDVNNVSILAARARNSFSTLEKRLQEYKEDYESGESDTFKFIRFNAAVNALKQVEVAPYNGFAKAIISQFELLKSGAAGPSNAAKRIGFILNLYKVNEALDSLLQGSYGVEAWTKKLDGVYQSYREAVDGVEKGIPIITINVHEKILELDERLTKVRQQCAAMVQGEGVDLVRKYRECLKAAKHVAASLEIARAMTY